MRSSLKPILAALIFAALFIASAYFLKGNTAKDWVQGVLYVVGFYLLFRYTPGMSKKCSARIVRK